MGFFHFDFYEIIVWVATIIMCMIAVACRRVPLKKPGGIGQPLPNPIALILPVVFFVTFAGLRKTIGDTYFYMHSFTLLDESAPVNFEVFKDSMFAFVQNIIRHYTDDPQWLIFITAALALPVPLYILYKYSYPFELSIFMFVAYGYLGGMMDGMRQYLAAAITICATKYLFSMKKTDFFKYAVIIVFASFMHNSALILLPLYFVVRRRAWQLSSYIIILGSAVAVIFFDKLMPTFLGALEETSYSNYAENGWFTDGNETGSSIMRVIAIVAPLVVAYLNRQRFSRLGHIGDILVNIVFVHMAINILALYNWIFARLSIYLMIYFIIFTVWVVSNAVKPRDRMVYCTGLVIAFFCYSRFLAYQIYMYQSDYFFPGRKLF